MKYINGEILFNMILSGCNNLNNQKNKIDALNVFPVPDGDTGTNMSMTFTNGLNEILKLDSKELSIVAKTLSKGLLMGARGNSGVILSQIFRGFYQSIDTKKELSVLDLSEAFIMGSNVAYKAVMRPVEGTILTVIREASFYTKQYVENNIEISVEQFFDVLCEEAKKSLDNTPNLLPVLKEVGVVDSGGAGLLTILEGFYAYIKGEDIQANEKIELNVNKSQLEMENDEFGYCTEFIVRLEESKIKTFSQEKLRSQLVKLGDSLVVVQDDDLVKVHVHTLVPGNALNIAQRYGEFVKIKIENMQEQHNTIINSEVQHAIKKDKKKYGIIAVASGDGLEELFKEYRVDVVISGGQTMNPSTEDFIEAINSLNAENIFILPNNSNIILAAKQAFDIVENKNIHVFETKSIPQGLSACIMFNPEVSFVENIDEMQEAINRVKTGQITYAIKDTSFEKTEIKEGDYIGIKEKEIIVAIKDKLEATKKLIDSLIDEESEILTLICGEDVSEDETSEIVSYIDENYDIETEIFKGNQPVYSFIIGVE